MREVVVVDRVTKIYPNGVKANVDVSMRVYGNEIVCVMGPNGAGKTTLIRQIIGMLKPTSGVIRVFGVDPLIHQDLVKRMVAYSPQLPIYYPAQKVLEVADFFAKISKTPRDRVREVLEALGLWDIRDRLGYQLSPGERKLLLLALALIKGGELLVLDEPTAFMDVLKKRSVWSMLLEERRRGRTLIVVSHDVEEVRRIGDEIYVMFAGRIVAHVKSPSDLSRGVEVRVYYGKLDDIAPFFKKGDVKISEGSLIARYNQLVEAIEDLEGLAANPISRDVKLFLEYPSLESIVESFTGK
jgi:ABC-2 type transport system ATP-binding protein